MPQSNRTILFLLGTLVTILVGWVLHVGAGLLQPLVIALLLAIMLQPVVRGLARKGIPPLVTVALIVVLLFFGLFRVGLVVQSNIEAFVDVATSRQATALQVGDDEVAGGGSQPPALAGPGEPEDAGRGAGAVGAAPSDGGSAGQDAIGDAEGADAEPPAEEADDPDRMVLDPLSKEQDRLSQQTGGWAAIVAELELRVNNTSMPAAVKRYVIDAIREIDAQALAAEVVGSGLDLTRNIILVLIYMSFIFAEQAVFRRKILAIADERREDAAEMLDTIGVGIQRYLGVKTLVSLATGAILYSVLTILDVPQAFLWGFLTFLLNYIPTFGSIIAGIFPTLMALTDAESGWGKAIIVAIAYLAVNLSLGSFIEPRILGRQLNLSPLVIIVSVVFWAGLWGVAGTFLAVPITAALQIVLASQENTRPIAILLSSGPPRSSRRSLRVRRRRRARDGT